MLSLVYATSIHTIAYEPQSLCLSDFYIGMLTFEIN